MSDASRWGVDWVRVVGNLQTTGMSLREICEAAGISKGALEGYRSEDLRQEPRHSTGELLLALWAQKTGNALADAPRWRRPMSVSEFMRCHT